MLRRASLIVPVRFAALRLVRPEPLPVMTPPTVIPPTKLEVPVPWTVSNPAKFGFVWPEVI